MSFTLTQNKLSSMIECDRKAVCDILKNNEIDEEICSKIIGMPHPVIPKSRGKKTKSDAPKKVSGYIIFLKDFRKNNKDMNSKDIVKAAGSEWSELDKESKKVWTDKANEMFEEAVQVYKETHPDYDPEEKKKANNKSDKPKKISGYLIFTADFRSKQMDMDSKDIIKAAGAEWKELDEENKKEWNKKANDTYLEAVKAYKETHPDYDSDIEKAKVKQDKKRFKKFLVTKKDELIESGIEDDMKKLAKEAKKLWKKLSEEEKATFEEEESSDNETGKKRKRKESVKVPSKKSAYNFFVGFAKNEVPEGEKLMEYASKKWKEMSSEEKERFNERSNESKAEYEKFKTFMDEIEPAIREELSEELYSQSDKNQKKMIAEAAAKKWYEQNN